LSAADSMSAKYDYGDLNVKGDGFRVYANIERY